MYGYFIARKGFNIAGGVRGKRKGRCDTENSKARGRSPAAHPVQLLRPVVEPSVPASQAVHTVWPVLVEYVPAPQTSHVLMPVPVLYVLALHSVQNPWSFKLHWPAGQGRQGLNAYELLYANVRYCPAAHPRHVVSPEPDA